MPVRCAGVAPQDLLAPALFAASFLALLGWAIARRFTWIHAEARMPGTARGPLQVVVRNRGARNASLRLRVTWRHESGREIEALNEELEPDLDGGTMHMWSVLNVQRALPAREPGWETLVVDVRPARGFARRVTLRMEAHPRETQAEPAPAVAYAAPVCSSGGAHRFAPRRVMEEGIPLDWEVCLNCQFVRPVNRSAQTEAAVRDARAARLQREAARIEDEQRRARANEPARRERPRASDSDTMSLEAAFWTLQLPMSASWDQVLAAHRRLARELHPDRAGPTGAERMADVNRARDRLREHLT